jgi:uncharacterized protein YjiS (DUF1127 family)
MLTTPMHNRFAEGFIESSSSGDTLDELSTKILDGHSSDLPADRRSISSATVAAAAAKLLSWARAGFAAFRAWRERERAAAELYALDDRALADLGLSRAEIPFILAYGAPERGPHVEEAGPPLPANCNGDCRRAA